MFSPYSPEVTFHTPPAPGKPETHDLFQLVAFPLQSCVGSSAGDGRVKVLRNVVTYSIQAVVCC